MDDPTKTEPPSPPSPSSLQDPPVMSFGRAVSFEASLVVIAAILAWFFGTPLLADFKWEWKATFLGLSSTLPMLAFFGWMLQSEYPPFVEIREFLNTFVHQLFGEWSIVHLAALSIVAGIGEEILFRGVLQSGIGNIASPGIGILVASFLFALCHALTKAYFISTFIIGIYLSLVWQASENLLTPIVTHAAYDFVALLYFKTWHAKNAASTTKETDE